MEYTDKVLEHFRNPRNVGVIEDADGVGEVGNPICGDMMKITIKVEEERIKDIKFATFGCGAAIAVSSMITEMAKGKTLEEALKITNKDVAEALGGLPKNKLHCSNLGADALKKAIMDYYAKKKGIERHKSEASSVEYIGEREGTCLCPYCEEEIPKNIPVCSKCGKLIK
ncbi:MAG: Fe-S cluster assembly scaffold protein NifU [Deltaproteobacteria bacterium]|nr:Fe-S cluster assembly scaffold protein NifU [Deltaproteobacteria bacterium]